MTDLLAEHRAERLVQPGTVVVDLGACVGAFAFPCAERGARVLAMEPVYENYRVLAAHPDVDAMHAAAGPSDGWCTLRTPPGEAALTGSWIEPGGRRPAHGGAYQVPMLSLGSIVAAAGGHVDVLKCDIQGGEYALFDGAAPSTLARIAFAAVEFHVWTCGDQPRRPGVGHNADQAPMPEGAVERLVEQLLVTHEVEVQGPPDAGGTVFAWRRP